MDFTDAATLSQINRWCSDKTDGKIPQMLEDLDPLTRLMLINALLYKAPWRDKWDLAQDRVFRGESTESRKDFIHADKSFGYADTDGFEAVRLPYGNGAYEMLAFLPKAGKTVGDILPAIAKTADALVLPERPAEVFLPKFSTAYFTGDNLNKVLTDKGLTLPFSAPESTGGRDGKGDGVRRRDRRRVPEEHLRRSAGSQGRRGLQPSLLLPHPRGQFRRHPAAGNFVGIAYFC